MTTLEKAVFLQTTAVFHHAQTEALNTLGSMADEMHLSDGQVLFAENEPAEAFYVVTAGALRYQSRGETVRRRGVGEVSGFWSVYDGDLRRVTATGDGEARLLRVWYADFRDIILDGVGPGRGVQQVLAREIENLVTAEARVWTRD